MTPASLIVAILLVHCDHCCWVPPLSSFCVVVVEDSTHVVGHLVVLLAGVLLSGNIVDEVDEVEMWTKEGEKGETHKLQM